MNEEEIKLALFGVGITMSARASASALKKLRPFTPTLVYLTNHKFPTIDRSINDACADKLTQLGIFFSI